ncbi:protein phosphatase 2C domain-containing protein [Cereibacter sphaeroides]|uniref:PP2C family protein-serine/threonine phosphatase n=1 Tax=Cereibacter sphaeroides TaxID=1063 RepID=UPI001F1787CC|nr:protein phosphatase 2C domain-containing protein [Cereibacter sphaeroides]MCE6950777.1 protein phosphatase 2C domain-containing protein [Cereibacter sphaeroides]
MTGPITAVPLPLPRVTGSGLTHRGRRRERNEDAILTDPTGRVWAVADGMGGYGHGDVAADIVIDHLETLSDGALVPAALAARIEAAHSGILAHARRRGILRMGATVVALAVERGTAHVAWVGDSRAYLLREGRLRPLTRDHSVVQALIDSGALSVAQVGSHPDAHVVTRAVGVGDAVEVDTVSTRLVAGDRLLLCSDGLTSCVDEPAIEDHLRAAPSPDDACLALVRAALDAGAPDNVSVIVVEIGGA